MYFRREILRFLLRRFHAMYLFQKKVHCVKSPQKKSQNLSTEVHGTKKSMICQMDSSATTTSADALNSQHNTPRSQNKRSFPLMTTNCYSLQQSFVFQTQVSQLQPFTFSRDAPFVLSMTDHRSIPQRNGIASGDQAPCKLATHTPDTLM